MAVDKSQRVDVCFTKTDKTPAPGEYAKQTTKSSAAEMEISNPYERKQGSDLQKIRSQTKWHTRVNTVPSIPGKGPVFFMPEDILPVIFDEESVAEEINYRSQIRKQVQTSGHQVREDLVI
jgi:hypothetical protein